MRRVLQQHEDKVMQVLAEHPQGIAFNGLLDKVSLVSVALENVLGELRRKFLVTVHRQRFFSSREFNKAHINSQVTKAVSSTKRAPRGSKKAAKREEMYPTVGGVEEYEYKLLFLNALIETHSDGSSVSSDIKQIRDDFIRMVEERAAQLQEAA